MADRKTLLDHDYAPKGLLRTAKQNPTVMFGLRTLKRFERPPFMLIGLVAALVIASFIPITASVYARFRRSSEPRVHLVQDMDSQAKYKAQTSSPVFADGRAMRLPVAGTVARGDYITDERYALGYVMDGDGNVEWVQDMPTSLEVNRKLLERGQELFNRFCWLCHGYDGYGNGPVNVRAAKGQNGAWVQPANLHSESVRNRPNGHIYNTIDNGIRNMAGYGTQIRDPKDRWAIVAYVRALQLSQSVPVGDLNPDLLSDAKVQPPLVNGQPPISDAKESGTSSEESGDTQEGQPASNPS